MSDTWKDGDKERRKHRSNNHLGNKQRRKGEPLYDGQPLPALMKPRFISPIPNIEKKDYCRDIRKLLNGVYDDETYLINDLEFFKVMDWKYKGAEADGHPKILFISSGKNTPISSGIVPETKIPYSHLLLPQFSARSKDQRMEKSINVMWQFLRKAKNEQEEKEAEQERTVSA